MKQYLIIIMAGFLFLTSCKKNDEDYYPYEDEGYDQFDDSNNSDQQGGSSDNYDGGDGELSLYAVNGNTISKIKDYNVSSDLKVFQDDKGKHQKMWE